MPFEGSARYSSTPAATSSRNHFSRTASRSRTARPPSCIIGAPSSRLVSVVSTSLLASKLCEQLLHGSDLILIYRVAHAGIDALVDLRAEAFQHRGRLLDPLERDMGIDIAAADE